MLSISFRRRLFTSHYIFQAAWGGGLLMSEKHRRSRFDGVERADSLTWNPHKLMGALLQCSTFHLKEPVSPSEGEGTAPLFLN